MGTASELVSSLYFHLQNAECLVVAGEMCGNRRRNGFSTAVVLLCSLVEYFLSVGVSSLGLQC